MLSIFDVLLHDAYIISIDVKTKEDFFEYIVLEVEHTETIASVGTNRFLVAFHDCSKAKFDLQMWIKGKDTIRTYNILSESAWLSEVSELKSKGYIPVTDRFTHFCLELNTTNSIIEILVKEITVIPVK